MHNRIIKDNKQVDIILGLKCNEKCFFCFQNPESISDMNIKVEKEDILKALLKGKNDGCNAVNITGGEPTIYKETFLYTIKVSKKLGYKTIRVITNGLLFSDLKFCNDSSLYITDICLSLHASNSELQDSITGVQGSYEKVLQAIRNISNTKINLHNHFVLNEKNYLNIEEHINNIISLGFVSVHFLFNMYNNSSIGKTEYASKIKYIIDNYKEQIRIECAYIPFCLMKGYEENVLGFEYGKKYVSNNPESLYIWDNLISSKKILEKKCNGCSYLDICVGL